MSPQSKSWWIAVKNLLEFRKELPKELAAEFEEFKDVKSIDRIQTAAWIAIFLTFCLFGLDYYRWVTGGFEKYSYYYTLVFIHLLGLLFIILAVHISRKKEWIIQTRLRRGIVIWGMVLLTFSFLLGQAVVVYYNRGTTTLYLGFVFVGSWMFAMSHKERSLFFLVSLTAITWCIIYRPDPEIMKSIGMTPEMIKLNGDISAHNAVLDYRLVSFIEVFFLSLVAFFFDGYDYNQKLDNFFSLRQIEAEQKRIRQLEEFKSRFYTNLTHEFRTPLTLINGMAREIAEDPKRWAREGTDAIMHHAGNLLDLINQILDLSKIESGSLSLHFIQGNIVTYLGYLIDSYRGHALAKKITFHYLCQDEEILMDYDPDKLKTIIGNLFSNAIKFSPEGSNIYVSLHHRMELEKDLIEIAVRDQGIGIPREDAEHIFERFYQVENEQSLSGKGTGIGLSLVRELVEVFQGKISVSSTPGKGAEFTLVLPVHHLAQRSNGDYGLAASDEIYRIQRELHFDGKPVSIADESRTSILIIEDNGDVSRYLEICLQDTYQLTFSKNGEEGIFLAIQNVPDLILCDVMMPVKDGLEVSREIKKNPGTSHIPVILLSAKAEVDARIAGLESGADVYMTKPFEKNELRAQIQNLLNRFKDYHLRYANPEAIPPKAQEDRQEVEDEFIIRIRNLVHQHLDDNEFSVHDLERGVFLSRSQLHKKLKALTGLSAMQYVSRIRLSVAREKLKTSAESVSDIAYQVGYSDPNYFSRAYSEEFGETPSETRNAQKKSVL